MQDLKKNIFERLKHSLQLLAASAETQLRLLPAFVCKADELALEFDHWREVVFQKYTEDLTASQRSTLEAVDFKLAWMSDNPDEHWTEEHVKESEHWREVRVLAAKSLDAFGWPRKTPPSYAHEYVPGGGSSH